MQVEIVQHKKYQENKNFCAHAFVLPNDEFCRQYLTSIKVCNPLKNQTHTSRLAFYLRV
jgi:hypothetical protein